MSLIYLRHATQRDLSSIMEIIHEAQALLKNDGSPQWQNGYSTKEVFQTDIQRNECLVLMVNDQVAGVATLAHDPQTNYQNLSDGHWNVTDQPYATIHRLALSSEFRGMHLSNYLMSNLISIGIEQGMQNFRIDTHAMNERMQSLIKSAGFQYCGIINQGDKVQERLGYELNL